MSSSHDPNRENLKKVAVALDDLGTEAVFVGGAVVGLLLTDSAAPSIRPTNDVDLVFAVDRISTWQTKLTQRLRELGFRETGDVICRWRVDGVLVDVMPSRAEILGFSNRWYPEAVATASAVPVDDTSIRLIAPVLFLATKIEAFAGRGAGDFYASHDIEDILAVINGRPEVVGEVASSRTDVRRYVVATFSGWLRDADFQNALEGHVESGRERIVQARLRLIVES